MQWEHVWETKKKSLWTVRQSQGETNVTSCEMFSLSEWTDHACCVQYYMSSDQRTWRYSTEAASLWDEWWRRSHRYLPLFTYILVWCKKATKRKCCLRFLKKRWFSVKVCEKTCAETTACKIVCKYYDYTITFEAIDLWRFDMAA